MVVGWLVGWLVVLGFNATLTGKVISCLFVMFIMLPGFLTPLLTQLFFQSHQLLFSHASAEMGGENMPKEIFHNLSKSFSVQSLPDNADF